MGISLNGLTPAGTYPGLIKTGDNTAISGTPKLLSDGNGNNLPMEVSTTGVNLTGSPTVNAVAIANTTQVAAKQDTLVSGTNIKTINGTSVLGSGNIVTPTTSPSGVSGAIQFSNGSAFASDASNLFWDDTNNRLGVGTNAPVAPIDSYVAGTGNGDFLVGKFGYQTGGNGKNVFVKIGAGNAQFDLNVETGNPFFELRYGNSSTAIGGGLAQRVRYDGVTAIPKNLVVGSGNAQTSNMLQVIGSGSTSATTSLLVQNSAGTEVLKVTDDGNAKLGFVGTNDAKLFFEYPRISGGIIFGDAISGGNVYGRISLDRGNGEMRVGAVGTGGYFLTLYSNGLEAARFDAVQSLGIGTTTINSSAKVQIDSTTKGFLMPRMTTTQKNAIASPATGLMVMDITTLKLCVYNGSSWVDLH